MRQIYILEKLEIQVLSRPPINKFKICTLPGIEKGPLGEMFYTVPARDFRNVAPAPWSKAQPDDAKG